MKIAIPVIPLNPGQRTRLSWIIQAVDRQVSRLDEHTDSDISAAAEAASKWFFRGESGARCIDQGVQLARQRLALRQANRSNVIEFVPFLQLRIL